MKFFSSLGTLLIMIILVSGCSKDQKTSAERDKEVQKVLQEGAQKEQKMYQGMQKAVENLEKKPQDQKDETKK